MPSLNTGICPTDIFTKTQWEQHKFHNFHVWGCLVYVLDKHIADGKMLPHWKPQSKCAIYMEASLVHASSVPLVLNLDSSTITSAFHIVFGNWFATVPLPDDYTLLDHEWQKLFGDLKYQYVLDDDDDDDDYPISLLSDLDALAQQDLVSKWIDQVIPTTPLPIPPPATPLLPGTPVNDDLPVQPLPVMMVTPSIFLGLCLRVLHLMMNFLLPSIG